MMNDEFRILHSIFFILHSAFCILHSAFKIMAERGETARQLTLSTQKYPPTPPPAPKRKMRNAKF
jgi:hypothetical protein